LALIKNKKIIIIVGVVILAIIGYLVNDFIGKKTAENKIENILEKQLNGNVDINTSDNSISIKNDQGNFNAGDATKWPTDMPSDVPNFTAGKLTMAGSVPTGWQVVAANVSKDDFVAYHSSLIANGWINVGTFDAGIGMVQMNKGNYDLIIAFNNQENTFVLTISVKK